MMIAVIDAWKQFENCTNAIDYNLKTLGSCILCSEKGNKSCLSLYE